MGGCETAANLCQPTNDARWSGPVADARGRQLEEAEAVAAADLGDTVHGESEVLIGDVPPDKRVAGHEQVARLSVYGRPRPCTAFGVSWRRSECEDAQQLKSERPTDVRRALDIHVELAIDRRRDRHPVQPAGRTPQWSPHTLNSILPPIDSTMQLLR